MTNRSDLDDPAFWTGRGCVMGLGLFVAVLAIAAAVYYAIESYTDGLLLVIVFLLAMILVLVATKR